MSQTTPTRPGQAVKSESGAIGITTDWIKLSGPNKGMLGVIFEGDCYEIVVDPAELTIIKLMDAAAARPL